MGQPTHRHIHNRSTKITLLNYQNVIHSLIFETGNHGHTEIRDIRRPGASPVGMRDIMAQIWDIPDNLGWVATLRRALSPCLQWSADHHSSLLMMRTNPASRINQSITNQLTTPADNAIVARMQPDNDNVVVPCTAKSPDIMEAAHQKEPTST